MQQTVMERLCPDCNGEGSWEETEEEDLTNEEIEDAKEIDADEKNNNNFDDKKEDKKEESDDEKAKKLFGF